MKYSIITTLGLLLFMGFTSCGKKKTIIVKFTDVVTGEGIPDIEFSIRKGETCLSYDGCGSKVVASGTTDAEGQDALTFRQRGSNNYFVSYPNAESFGYYILDGSLSVLDINDGEIKEIKLLPSCEVKEIYTNVNCFDENDEFGINRVHQYYSYPSNYFVVNGCGGYIENEFTTTAAGEVTLEYYVKRNGVTEYFTTNQFMDPFSENIIQIDY